MLPWQDALHEALATLPAWLKVVWWGIELWQWMALSALLAVSILIGRLVERAALMLVPRLLVAFPSWREPLRGAVRGPLRWLVALALLANAPAWLELDAATASAVGRWLRVAVVLVVGVLGLRLVVALFSVVDRRLEAAFEQPDNIEARAALTRTRFLRQLSRAVVVFVTLAAAMLQFPAVRAVGLSLLASAGAAGLVLGVAAQRSLGSLFAGIMLTLTQPIRIDDVVIVEGEWGRIEEIHLTYVVVKIWDERRLVVPITYFLERPFQNWTKSSSQLLGTIYLYADYGVDIDAMRGELSRLLEAHPKWDGRAQGLIVTELERSSVQLRALVSASNAGDLWDLRCDVREGLLKWLQASGASALPRIRVEGRSDGGAAVA